MPAVSISVTHPRRKKYFMLLTMRGNGGTKTIQTNENKQRI